MGARGFETEDDLEHAKVLAERAGETLAAAGGRPKPDEVVELVWWAMGQLDWKLVDEVIGQCAGLDSPARTVSYLAKAIADRGGQAGVEVEPFRAVGGAASA